jgi:MFS family permease
MPPLQSRAVRRLRGVAVDTTALRDSRDYRVLVIGGLISGIGTQVTLVALPFQVFVLTRSSFQVGLIGLVELLPLVVVALLGGTLADRVDRRGLLLASQLVQAGTSFCLVLGAAAGTPPVGVLYLIAAVAAGASAVDRPTRAAMVPALVGPDRLRSAISFNYGLVQVAQVVGPAIGGILIAAAGLTWAYAVDLATFGAMIVAVMAIASPPQPKVEPGASFLAAVRDGIRFAARSGELMGSFAIDILAMTFGMPRALFPALALTVYHAGPAGVGVLYAAVSAGAVVAAFSTGWLIHARRLGRIVVFAVAVWGTGIAVLGLTSELWAGALCLLAAGAADSVSAVCRSTILQTATPDEMRGRMSAIFTLVVAGGPRLGDVESGTVAAVTSTRFSVVSGGLVCVLGILPVVAAFPAFWRYGEEPAA